MNLTTHPPSSVEVKNGLNYTSTTLYAFMAYTGTTLPILTLWSRVILETLLSLRVVKKFPACHRTRIFIAVFKTTRQFSLSRAISVHSTASHPIPERSILITFFYLRLGLTSSILPSRFSTKCSHARITFGNEHKSWNSKFWNYLHPPFLAEILSSAPYSTITQPVCLP